MPVGTRRFWAGIAWVGLGLIAAGAARADTRTVKLAPPDTQVTFTTYAMGMFPLPGHYTSFTGALILDPARPGTCAVDLDVDVASLDMADPARERMALGPKLMDQARFPHMLYRGSCQGGLAQGVLTMHGVARPLLLKTRRTGNIVTAEGSLRRGDFGVGGMPGLIGGTIRIAFVVNLPSDLAGLVGP